MQNVASDNFPLQFKSEIKGLASRVSWMFDRPDLREDIEMMGCVSLLEMSPACRARGIRYIMTVVRNDMIDKVRKGRYLNDYSGKFIHFPYSWLEDGIKHVQPGSSKVGLLPDAVRSAAGDFVEQPRCGRVELFDVLDRIKESQAKLLILYWVCRYTQEELSDQYKVSRSMIARRLKVAMAACKKVALGMEEKKHEEECL